MNLKQACSLCGAEILPETAKTTGGICMPCKYRPKVHLTDDQKRVYDETRSLLLSTGWRDTVPHMRIWLDIELRLGKAIKRGDPLPYVALAVDLLKRQDCRTSEDAFFTLGRLRRCTDSAFPADHVKYSCFPENKVVFSINDREFTLSYVDSSTDKRLDFLRVVNFSLQQTKIPQRFLILPSSKSPWPLAFTTIECFESACSLGIIPSAGINGALLESS